MKIDNRDEGAVRRKRAFIIVMVLWVAYYVALAYASRG